MSKLCQKIAVLQSKARKQAEEVSTQLDDPSKLIDSLRDQVATVTSIQKCVKDLSENKQGLSKPELEQLQKTFKELARVTDENHRNATKKGIRLTPKVHRTR